MLLEIAATVHTFFPQKKVCKKTKRSELMNTKIKHEFINRRFGCLRDRIVLRMSFYISQKSGCDLSVKKGIIQYFKIQYFK